MSPAHDDPRFLVAPPPAPPRRARGAWLPWVLALLAALVPVVYHHQYANGQAIVYEGDAAQLQMPRYVTLCDALHRGELPAWQTLVYAGSPFHANPENPTLYPPTLLFAALSGPGWTINLTILLHLALCGLGMFLLVRRLARRAGLDEGPASAGALLGATLFAFSLFTRRDHINFVAYGAAHALIPWMLLAADGVIHGARPRRSAGLLALIVAALFTTGGLYVFPYAYLALVVWMVALGLLGGREARRRTLRFGGWAALLALLIVSAKVLPYRDWMPTTNRAGILPVDEARADTLGGTIEHFSWWVTWVRVTRFLGGPVVLLPGLLAFAMLREGTVRVALGLVLLGFLIGLGGTVWRFFYDHVPPFDRVRVAWRAWTLVNASFPIVAGMGVAWLLQRVAALRRSQVLSGLCGVALMAVYVPLLTHTDTLPRQRLLREPDTIDHLLELYPRWTEAARLSGTRWRVGSLDHTRPDDRNEQFATSLLGAETVSGYQGHVWPTRLAEHLYGDYEVAPLPREVRLRRLGVLSARWLVETSPEDAAALELYLKTKKLPDDPALAADVKRLAETVPPGIEGSELVANPFARPRVILPAAVVGVVGDADDRLTRALLDEERFPLDDASLVALPADGATDEELAALDALLVVAPPGLATGVADELRPHLPAQAPVLEVPPASDAGYPASLVEGLADTIAELAAKGRTVEPTLERDGASRALLHVATTGDARGRFAVVSEAWSWYPGWRVEGLEDAPALRIADGVATAFLIPAGVVHSPLVARYAPAATRKGLILAAIGLALALGMVLWPARARRDAAQRGA